MQATVLPQTEVASSPVPVQLEPSWREALAPEFEKPYFRQLVAFLKAEKAAGKVIFPAGSDIFRAFELTPVPNVRVVILGQDPYHGPGQAHGLSFSVPPGVVLPPSLQNIAKEIHEDLGLPLPMQGNLDAWARQGVLLLNATLTVEAGKAGSHQKQGWEPFTDAVIQYINRSQSGIVFILWGRYAREKGQLIDPYRHHVLTAAHPSPFAADKGFFGCKHFSRTNAILEQQGKAPIDWRIGV